MNDRPDILPVVDELAMKAAAELEADHRRELKCLSDLAFIFLNGTDGDRRRAENLLDDCIDLLFEDGVLSTWHYRIVLNQIREGGCDID